MEGTATISLDTLDELRKKAEEAETEKKPDKQCSKLVREAMVKHLKIVIDQEELKELIQEYIDEEASDEHLDIAKASMKELKQIQVVLKE